MAQFYASTVMFTFLVEDHVKVALHAQSGTAISSYLLLRGPESFHFLLYPLPHTQTKESNKPGAFMNT